LGDTTTRLCRLSAPGSNAPPDGSIAERDGAAAPGTIRRVREALATCGVALPGLTVHEIGARAARTRLAPAA
jgi:hypothetical protein